MLDTLLFLINVLGFIVGASVLVAGTKACIFNGGPGPFELAGMLWRGEIKGK